MMHFLWRGSFAAVLSLLVAGCASAPPAPDAAPSKTMKLVMQDGSAAPVNDWDINVQLGVIPGKLLGRPSDAPTLLIPAAFDKEFTISLPDVERTLASAAAPASDALVANGLAIAPADTRFFRTTTFIFDKKQQRIVHGGGFYEDDGEFALLVYFDRACTIHGVEQNGSFRLQIDLQIPKTGLYWLRFETLATDRARLILGDPGRKLHFGVPR